MTHLLLTTGGTIDAAAYPEDGSPYPPDITAIGEMRACRAMRDIVPDTVCIALFDKDSKALAPDDIALLADTIAGAKDYARIIVTTGTDRMPEIARDIKARALPLSCPVVFTGAFLPLANGAHSDGYANLRKAALEQPDLATGVYIAAGDIFADPATIFKDFEKRVFVLAR